MSAPFRLPYRTSPDTLDAIRADLDHMLGRVALAEAEPDPTLGADAVEVLCRKSRELFTRRALEQAAEHAAAMLPALGLPMLVPVGVLKSEHTPFVPFDPTAALDALDAAIVALDALDADPDLEPWLAGDPTSGAFLDLEAEDLDEDDGTGEHTLGAPERSPYAPPMGASFYKPANGRRPVRCFRTRAQNQVEWAAGLNADGEGESEPGYDLPEGDDEKCGSEHDGCEPEEKEGDLGSAVGNGDQEHWAQGAEGCYELVDEDGEEGGGSFLPAARPISPRWPDPMGHAMRDDARTLARRARDVRARLYPATFPARDPDTLTILRSGVALWSGPYVTRDGVPVVGSAT